MASADIDYYELLQVSPNADVEVIQRLYRVLAARVHPDNQTTGDVDRFRLLTEAYHTLVDAERRTQYDLTRPQRQRQRAQLLAEAVRAHTDVHAEQLVRLTVLEVLYGRRRVEPTSPGMFDVDLEEFVDRPREHLQFTLWYLLQKGFVIRGDSSRLFITAEGIDYFEDRCAAQPELRMLAAPPS